MVLAVIRNSIWTEDGVLALVFSWPATVIDRLLVPFQGKAGG